MLPVFNAYTKHMRAHVYIYSYIWEEGDGWGVVLFSWKFVPGVLIFEMYWQFLVSEDGGIISPLE